MMANTCFYSLKGNAKSSVKVHSDMNTLIPPKQWLQQFDQKYPFKLNDVKKNNLCATYKKHVLMQNYEGKEHGSHG